MNLGNDYIPNEVQEFINQKLKMHRKHMNVLGQLALN